MSTLNTRSYSSLKNIEVKGQGTGRGGIYRYKGTNSSNPVGSGANSFGTFINSEKQLTFVSEGNTKVIGNIDENVTATNVITAGESGKTFFLNSATEFVSTLPAPVLGFRATFIVTGAPSGASYTIVTTSSANIIKGAVFSADLNAASDGDIETSGGDTISFVDSKAVAGDRVEIYCDGTNYFAHAFTTVFDAVTITTAS